MVAGGQRIVRLHQNLSETQGKLTEGAHPDSDVEGKKKICSLGGKKTNQFRQKPLLVKNAQTLGDNHHIVHGGEKESVDTCDHRNVRESRQLKTGKPRLFGSRNNCGPACKDKSRMVGGSGIHTPRFGPRWACFSGRMLKAGREGK